MIGNALGMAYLGVFVNTAAFDSQMAGVKAKFYRDIAAMQATQKGLFGKMAGVHGAVGSAFAGTMRTGAGLAAGFGLYKIVTEAAEFQQAMANVRAVTQASAADFALLEAAARKAGRETVFTATESANALEEMGKLGMSAENSIAALPGALQLAAAGDLSIAEAATIAGRNMNVFGKDTSDLTDVNDTLAAAAVKSATDIKNVARALSYAGPSAKAAGMSISQTVSILMAMADSGIEASRAGTALRNVIETLRTPSTKQTKILAEMGIDPKDFRDAKTGFLDVIGFLEEFERRGGVNRSVELFGKRGGTEIMAAMGLEGREEFGPGVQGIRDREKAVEAAKGIAKSMAEIRLDTFRGQLKLTVSALSDLAIELGTGGILQSLGIFVGVLTKGANALVYLNQKLGGAIGWTAGAAVGVALLAASLWLGIAAVRGLVAAFTLLMSHPILAIFSLLAMAIVGLIGYLDAMGIDWTQTWNRAKNDFADLYNYVTGRMKALKDLLIDGWVGVGAAIRAALSGKSIDDAFNRAISRMDEFRRKKEALERGFQLGDADFDKSVGGAFKDAWAGFGSAVEAAIKGKNPLEAFQDAIAKLEASRAMQNAREMAEATKPGGEEGPAVEPKPEVPEVPKDQMRFDQGFAFSAIPDLARRVQEGIGNREKDKHEKEMQKLAQQQAKGIDEIAKDGVKIKNPEDIQPAAVFQ